MLYPLSQERTLLKRVILDQMGVELVMTTMSGLVFYSWQSDLPGATNKNFILRALENAAKALRNDDSLTVEPVIDRDTLGVPGSPNISETIFGKIDQAQVFVCDISIINLGTIKQNPNARLTSNPNVLLELGYALKTLGDKKIILVLNDAYGVPELLPFDLRMRRVTRYHMPEEDQDRASERKHLEEMLKDALYASLSTVNIPMPGETIQPVSKAEQARIAIEADRPYQDSLVRQYMAELARHIDSMTPIFTGNESDEQLIRATGESTSVVSEFARLAEMITQRKATEAGRAMYKGFGGILDLYTFPPPPRSLRYNLYDHDFAKFLGHELFVTFFALLIREERWELISELFEEDLQARKGHCEPAASVPFSKISQSVVSLEVVRRQRLRSNHPSLHADLLNERHTQGDLANSVPMEHFAEADFFLYLRAQVQEAEVPQNPALWMPWSWPYLRQPPRYLREAERIRFAQKLLHPLGIEDISTLRERLQERTVPLTRILTNGYWPYALAGFNYGTIGSR